MCTLVLLRRPDHDWPLLIAANRDEMVDRPWLPPARHWPDREDVVAGKDLEAGGSWLGVNDHGVATGILNRPGALGPAPGKRSRGELVLEALDHGDARHAAEALADLNGEAWRPFNMIVADCRDAFFIRHQGGPVPDVVSLDPGLWMVTSHDPNDRTSARVAGYLDRFRDADPPDPEADDWRAWQDLLAESAPLASGDPLAAMTIATQHGFATVSSSLIALPGPNIRGPAWRWRFAAGSPDRHDHEAVSFQ